MKWYLVVIIFDYDQTHMEVSTHDTRDEARDQYTRLRVRENGNLEGHLFHGEHEEIPPLYKKAR